MFNTNPAQDTKPYYINNIPNNSSETYEILRKLSKTYLNELFHLSQSCKLQKTIKIFNPSFENEFKTKSREFKEKSSFPEHWDVRYGFLATVKEKMIEKFACEGLKVQMCPYNYLGYNIAGVHLSQNADVCITEAKAKIGFGDELILILFQYMLGKRKIVSMYDPKILLAPTPRFDSHICGDRPDPKEKESLQYIKSLVYLYEFDNAKMDPVIRPRHCCPIAALVFKNIPSYETLDIVCPEPTNMLFSSYQRPLKPVSQHRRPSLLGRPHRQSELKKSPIIKKKTDEETPTKSTNLITNLELKLDSKEMMRVTDDLPGVYIERRDKPKIEYIRMYEYLSKNGLSDATFISVTQIPNILKWKAVEDRQLFIRQVENGSKTSLNDMVTNQRTVEISAANEDIELTDLDDHWKIVLSSGSTVRLEADKEEDLKKIQIGTQKDKRTLWSVEVFERNQKTWDNEFQSWNEKFGRIDEEYTDPSNNMSFLRKELERKEIDMLTRFFHVSLGVAEYANKRLPLAANILDYDGEILFSHKITPRGKVADYRKSSHGLSEEMVINQIDEAQASDIIRDMLEGTIVVGHRVLESLRALEINLTTLYGIRDLADAKVFVLDEIKKKKNRFSIHTLTEKYLLSDIHPTYQSHDLSLKINLIRRIYLKVLEKWEDHKVFLPSTDLEESFYQIKFNQERGTDIDALCVLSEIDMSTGNDSYIEWIKSENRFLSPIAEDIKKEEIYQADNNIELVEKHDQERIGENSSRILKRRIKRLVQPIRIISNIISEDPKRSKLQNLDHENKGKDVILDNKGIPDLVPRFQVEDICGKT